MPQVPPLTVLSLPFLVFPSLCEGMPLASPCMCPLLCSAFHPCARFPARRCHVLLASTNPGSEARQSTFSATTSATTMHHSCPSNPSGHPGLLSLTLWGGILQTQHIGNLLTCPTTAFRCSLQALNYLTNLHSAFTCNQAIPPHLM